jgi:tetratricopeptide (TPR) repeat protein
MLRLVSPSLAMLALLLLSAIGARAHDAKSVACQNADKTPAVVEPNLALEKNPSSLDTRFRLASALIDQRCYDAAVHVLEAGEELHPRNTELQAKLRHARSLISEQQYFEGLDRAELAARISRNLLRCNKLGDLSACDEALALKPDDPDTTTAKADALARAKRPAEALSLYRRAIELGANKGAIDTKLGAAEAQRQTFAASCQSDAGNTALVACRGALVRDANDEFAIQKRIAILLQADNQLAPALDAYLAANSLQHDDRSVALAIVTLSDSTGRNDALTLAARGSALLTLGRAREAVPALRQAQALAPGVGEIKVQLATAERLARAEARSASAANSSERVALAATATPSAVVATPARTYSNAADPTRSH